MKPIHHLAVILICLGLMLYHYIVNYSILTHPYMVGGVGIYHAVLAIKKIVI
jgi:hypothetical protein